MTGQLITTPSRKKVTLRTLHAMRKNQIPASFITAYDYPSAVFAERAGIDMILIGDSGGMTMLGYPNTMPVTMEDMLHFTKGVVRGSKNAFIIGDMPFMSYQICDAEAVQNAGKFMAAGCDAIKLEGSGAMCDRIRAITDAGIPVMSHLGLTPQSLSLAGGYRVHAKTWDETQKIMKEAQAVERAGASLLLLEAMPESSADMIRQQLNIPVYGIGAGARVDGQLLIFHDLVGSFVGDIKPKFVKQYANVGEMIVNALIEYDKEVKSGQFPNHEYNYQ